MQTFNVWLEQRSQKEFYYWGIFLSFFLSGLSLLLSSGVGNDGILYLRGAEIYHAQGLRATMALYPWPFYSIVISGVHSLLGVSYITAAKVLNVFFQAWTVYFFLRLVFHFNKAASVGFWALLCILCYGPFNALRHYLLRDFGYWAFYLSALWTALHFLKTQKQFYLWAAGLSMGLALLFRIEGVLIALAIILPFLLMPGFSMRQRWVNTLILAWPFFLGAIIFFCLGSPALAGGGRLQDISHFALHGFSDLMAQQKQAIALLEQAWGPHYVFAKITPMYYSMLIAYFISVLISATGVIYSLIAGYGLFKRRLLMSRAEKYLFSSLMVSQLLVFFIFLAQRLFLELRYVMSFSFILLIWVPVALEALYQRSFMRPKTIYRQGYLMLIAAVFILSLLQGFVHFKGASKGYIYQGISFLKSRVQEQDRILVNNAMVLYYVKGSIPSWDEDLLTRSTHQDCQFSAYRYVVILSRHHGLLSQCQNLSLVKTYQNKEGNRLEIYEPERGL